MINPSSLPRHGASLIGLKGAAAYPFRATSQTAADPDARCHRVDEQDRARPQRRRKDQPAVGAEDDKMIAAYGLHERRIGYETGKAEKD